MDQPLHRINSSLLNQNVGNVVRLVGRVLSVQGPQCLIEASDHGHVQVLINEQCQLNTPYVEIIGRVLEDQSINAMIAYPFGEYFDLDTYDQMLKAMEKAPHLFY